MMIMMLVMLMMMMMMIKVVVMMMMMLVMMKIMLTPVAYHDDDPCDSWDSEVANVQPWSPVRIESRIHVFHEDFSGRPGPVYVTVFLFFC